MTRLQRVPPAAAALGAGLAILLVTFAAMWPLERMPVNRYAIDAAHSLLAAKLIGLGKALHTEVLTPLGDLALLPFAWGRAWGETEAAALAYARLIDGAAVALLAPLVCWRRLSAYSALLVGAAMTATALMPMNLGEDPWLLSSAMEYNKAGFALAGLGFCLLVPGAPGGAARDSLCAAVIVLMCFHLKISFGLALAGALAAGFALQRRRAPAFAVVAVIAAAAALSPDYLAALRTAGLENYDARTGPSRLAYLALGAADILALVAAAAVLFAWSVERRAARTVAIAALIAAASFVMLTQNEQRTLLPAAAAAPILLFEAARRLREGGERLRAAVVGLGALAAVYPAEILGHWLLGAWHYSVEQRRADRRIASAEPALSGLTFPAAEWPRRCEESDSALNYMLQVEEAARILREARVRPGDRVLYVDHLDAVALIDPERWTGPALLWRVGAAAINDGSEAADIVIAPAGSPLAPEMGSGEPTVAPAGFHPAGTAGCTRYFARVGAN